MIFTRIILLTSLAGVSTAWLTVGPNSDEGNVRSSELSGLTRPAVFEPLVADLLEQPQSLLSQDPALDKKISVSFHGANLDDVLAWLSSQGISFVADHSFPKPQARLTMRIESQSLRDALLAVADVFGGVWQKQGEIYVLKARTDPPTKRSPAVPEEFGQFDSQAPKQADEFEKRMREWSERFAKEWKHFQVPELKLLEEWVKELEERFRQGGRKEFQGGRSFVFPPGEWKSIDPNEFFEDFAELKARIEQFRSGLWPELVPNPKEWRERLPKLRFGGDLKKLLESITPGQWKIHEDRGWLTPDDLTEDQRAMLGFQGSGNFDITININDKKLKIKSS